MNGSLKVVLAGHGGQGVISMTEMLGAAATLHDLHATCHMVYGAEMRGGIVRCYLTIATEETDELLIEEPDGVVLMNLEAWDNVRQVAQPGSWLVVNSSLVPDAVPPHEDVRLIRVPCNHLAEEAGSGRTLSMVALGCVLELTDLVPESAFEAVLREVLPERHHKLIPVNLAAMEAGRRATRDQLSALTS